MKRNFILAIMILSVFSFYTTAFAAEADVLDVFEEYATRETEEFYTEGFSVSTAKNTPVQDKLRFVSTGGAPQFVITSQPQKGSLEIIQTSGEFTYTPFPDAVGEDSFSYRITLNGTESNISSCTITIQEEVSEEKPEQTPPEGTAFVYEDMQTHWANYSAVKMLERDIIKGERIGNRYYFYPETSMRRIDVLKYLLAALGADLSEADENETHIFADSTELPEYINKIAYVANKLGILDGEQRGDKVYLNPYATITRAELIKMIDTAMRSKTMSDVSLEDFADAGAVPDWAVQHVKNLLGYGIIKGFDDKTIRPYETLTKAQTVEMLYQMIKYNDENSVETISSRIKQGFYGKIIA